MVVRAAGRAGGRRLDGNGVAVTGRRKVRATVPGGETRRARDVRQLIRIREAASTWLSWILLAAEIDLGVVVQERASIRRRSERQVTLAVATERVHRGGVT